MSFNFLSLRSVLALAALLVFPGFSSVFAQDVRVETQQQVRARQQNVLPDNEEAEEVADPELGDINLVSRQPRPKLFTSSPPKA